VGLLWLSGQRHMTENQELRLWVFNPRPCQQFSTPDCKRNQQSTLSQGNLAKVRLHWVIHLWSQFCTRFLIIFRWVGCKMSQKIWNQIRVRLFFSFGSALWPGQSKLSIKTNKKKNLYLSWVYPQSEVQIWSWSFVNV